MMTMTTVSIRSRRPGTARARSLRRRSSDGVISPSGLLVGLDSGQPMSNVVMV